MEKYLVGGAVRDSLLKLPVTEKDWVITGSNPQEMLKIGYEQVGKDFPVFLHPKNHEEYALARTEKKLGRGYTGFICHTAPSVTIEEDLYRRDLTINAMAYDMYGNLLDPYNGQRDIKLRLLRHVSQAFHEDPLRVLRVARFAAKFKNLGFNIASETLELMKKMTVELKYLSSERIWAETKKALITNRPDIYFKVLRQCGALKILFPELDVLFQTSIPRTKYYLSENIGDDTMFKLSNLVHINNNLSLRFAILCCNFNKIVNHYTPTSLKPYNFYQQQAILIDNFCSRLKTPRKLNKLAKIISIYYDYLYDFTVLSPTTFMEIFKAFNCWKYPDNINQIICINKSNALQHANLQDLYSQEKFLRIAFTITTHIHPQDIIKSGFNGAHINKELYRRRLCVLKNTLNYMKNAYNNTTPQP